ncbi:MAG TPA: hypothetical protein DEP78_01755 [Verrucomicrobiales bacterium]|nr:hypothetical protein [Verrucomicrobiales bacterium]
MTNVESCPENDLMHGVIEGFYGPPWSHEERLTVLDWMAAFGLNTYFYAPKDDLKQRLLWREAYVESELHLLRDLIEACRQRGIQFVFALSPGLDMKYHSEAELSLLKAKCHQIRQLGGEHFAILFDDIPDVMGEEDQASFSDFAAAHCHVANQLYLWLKESMPTLRFLFCPTPYCARMRQAQLGGSQYLERVGQLLNQGIDVFWTGPEIISSEIPITDVQEIGRVLQRPPLIWDNLHANDYDGRRFYCGPYSGRPLALRKEVRGILHNPNNEALLNYVPWKTFADYVHATSDGWDARDAYLRAMQQWHDSFESQGRPISLEAFLLFGDCFYLPQEHGEKAQLLLARAQKLFSALVARNPEEANLFKDLAIPLRDTCREMVHLKNRSLFTALYRRNWDLREEMDLLLHCLDQMEQGKEQGFYSDYHLPGTYRGGLLADLQSLLKQQPDASFRTGSHES